MTNAEAWFNNSLRPRKPEGSLGRTAQDDHLDSHTAPELCGLWILSCDFIIIIMEICKALTQRLKTLNKQRITQIMYMEMEKNYVIHTHTHTKKNLNFVHHFLLKH